jgi:PPOX class probable F420-dependent enzyme
MTKDEVDEFLEVSRVAVLTTLGADGWPHATGMWYVCVDDSLRMWTYAKSQKVVNLARDARCAAVIEAGEEYEELRGVLIKARAILTSRPDEVIGIGRALYERYTKHRTGIAYHAGPALEIERQARKRVGILLPLQSLSSWDHSKLR